MSNILLRMLYAVICVLIFWWVTPLFLQVIGFPMSGQVVQLVRIIVACLALLYVAFGPTPPRPWA